MATINGTAGDDILNGTAGNDVIRGLAGSDYLYGETGNNTLDGGDGNDNLQARAGDSVLLGGDGDDYLYKAEAGTTRLEGGNGNDFLDLFLFGNGKVAKATLLGGSGNDRFELYVDAGTSVALDAGSGADRIELRTVYGSVNIGLGSEVDTLAFTGDLKGLVNTVIVGDFVAGPWGDLLVWGTDLKARLIGWNGTTNPFQAGYFRLVQSGSSTLIAVDADAGASTYGFQSILELRNVVATDLTTENLGGYSLIPVKNGSGGANTLTGGNAAERLNGLGGNDVLLGKGGNDLLVGDSGNDRLDGGTGADQTFGGLGDDVHVVDSSLDRVFELSGQGTDRIESTVSFTIFDHVENLTLLGTDGISGVGNVLANRMTGNGAANSLMGGDGNDTIDGGAGSDWMWGGYHDDIYFVDVSGDIVVEHADEGTDTVNSRISYTLGDHVENLTLTGTAEIDGTGNALANVLTGNDARNRLDGGLGADTMIGGKGNDLYVVDNYGDRVIEAAASGNDAIYSSVSYTLPAQVEKLFLTGTKTLEGRGNAASNTIVGTSNGNVLKGNDGDDKIDGGGSHDRLYGGNGNDILTGGVGNDGFYFDTRLASNNVDSLADFSPANDTIHLSAKIFRGIAGGTLSANAFHQGSAAADAADRIVYEAASGRIFYDADGAGAAAQILFATVTPGTALTSADFVI